MKFELKMALRFLRSGKGQSLFILFGIAIGVAVQVFLGTLITGLQEDLVDSTVGNSAHIRLKAQSSQSGISSDEISVVQGNFTAEEKTLSNWEAIVSHLDADRRLRAVSPIVSGNGFIVKSSTRSPVVLRGIDLGRADGIYGFEENLRPALRTIEANGALVGSSLAQEYALDEGQSFLIELSGGRSARFVVAGIFDLGSEALNESWVFLNLSRAQKLLGYGGNISSVEMQVDNVFRADIIAASLDAELLDVSLSNWKEENQSLLGALQSQSSSSYTIQFFVLMAITLGIASVLAVSVVQKQRQIGILKAMGASGKSTRNIFILQGGILGFLGALLGMLIGFLLIQGFVAGTSASTGVPLFPLRIRLDQTLIIVAITTLASVGSAIVPARNSARMNPIDVMKG